MKTITTLCLDLYILRKEKTDTKWKKKKKKIKGNKVIGGNQYSTKDEIEAEEKKKSSTRGRGSKCWREEKKKKKPLNIYTGISTIFLIK